MGHPALYRPESLLFLCPSIFGVTHRVVSLSPLLLAFVPLPPLLPASVPLSPLLQASVPLSPLLPDPFH